MQGSARLTAALQRAPKLALTLGPAKSQAQRAQAARPTWKAQLQATPWAGVLLGLVCCVVHAQRGLSLGCDACRRRGVAEVRLSRQGRGESAAEPARALEAAHKQLAA